MATITISRQFGSNGNEIAKKVCELAGYSLFDKHMIAKVAAEVGLSDQEIVDFSEDNYKVRGFLDRLLGRSQSVANIWVEGGGGVKVKEEVHLNEENALELVRNAVRSAHKMSKIVIVGRGGQAILKHHADVLHVRIEAPLEDRIQRVRAYPVISMNTYVDPIEERRAAQDLIDQNDAASADYLRRFYGIDWADPYLYHFVINSSKLSIEKSAKIIIEAARQLS